MSLGTDDEVEQGEAGSGGNLITVAATGMHSQEYARSHSPFVAVLKGRDVGVHAASKGAGNWK